MNELAQRLDRYRLRLRDAMRARNIGNDELAARMGGNVHTTTISRLRNGKMPLTEKWRYPIATAIGLSHDALFGDEPLPVPTPDEIVPKKKSGRTRKAKTAANDNLHLYGRAAGAAAGAVKIDTDAEDTVPCPIGVQTIEGAYALRVHGSSMSPALEHGVVIYIDPNRTPVRGEFAIIQTERYAGDGIEAWVKRYLRADDQFVYTEQFNPPGEIRFSQSEVRAVHRVVPWNEVNAAI